VEQKGIDLVARAADDLIAMGADLAILGSGEAAIAGALERLRAARPDRVGLRIGYDERLSHLIIAGCDLFLMPSRYEPCGLAQMHAMRYGTVPVVRRTGGLVDTVRDQRGSPGEGTGFVFDDPSAEALGGAVRRALALHRSDPRAWRD
jgi:starch synthase